ncbi:MAG: hypothetical protein HFJ59_05730 [Clostridia bacterium]|nr:hypothetical protein [Clostridia bacterium]
MEVKEKEITTEEKLNEEKIFKPVENYNIRNNSNIIKVFCIISLFLILIIFTSFIIFTLLNGINPNIISGVYINNINVSGLSREEALKKVKNEIISEIPKEITLIHDKYKTTLSVEELSINYDIESAIDKATQIGKSGNILQNNLKTIECLFSKENINIDFSFNEDFLKSDLEDASSKLPDKIIQSSSYIEDNNIIITKGKSGCIIDIEKSAEIIKQNIKNINLKDNIPLVTYKQNPNSIDIEAIHKEIYKNPVDAYYVQNPYQIYPSENGLDFAISLEEAKNLLNEDKDEYIIPLKITYPNITTSMIGTEAFPDLLSEFSTNYAISNRNRTTNLILAANKINGLVLMPGETFSYNKIVGERTISAGYKEAPIYVEGRVENGIGGGICQITTTLYNAVLYANLEIIERSNHQFVPSYANASRDATVVYGAIDFKFKNNRDYPIKLTCSVEKGIANFKIFGLKTNNDYEVIINSRITGSTSNAIYSEAYKTLKQHGNVISTELLSKDTYKKH